MSLKNTCQDCTKREPGCHDRCKAYREAMYEHISEKNWLKKLNKNYQRYKPNIKKWGQR